MTIVAEPRVEPQVAEITAEDVNNYLASLHAAGWGQFFSIYKPDDRQRAVEYILRLTGRLAELARKRESQLTLPLEG